MGNIFLSILGISVSIGLVVIGLIFLTPFLNKRYAAKWKYLIWIFLALRLLIPFGGTNGQYVLDSASQPNAEMGTKFTRKKTMQTIQLAQRCHIAGLLLKYRRR